MRRLTRFLGGLSGEAFAAGDAGLPAAPTGTARETNGARKASFPPPDLEGRE